MNRWLILTLLGLLSLPAAAAQADGKHKHKHKDKHVVVHGHPHGHGQWRGHPPAGVHRVHRGQKVRVRWAPPPVRVEMRARPPSRRHVWVPGYWGWRSERHYWVAGTWMVPPQTGWLWVEPRWVAGDGEWLFEEGHWEAVAPPPPPPPATGVSIGATFNLR